MAGCESFQSRFVGTWISEKQSLKLNADHTFSETAGRTAMNGVWNADGKSLILTPEQINGRPTTGFVEDLYDQLPKSPHITQAQLKAQEEHYLSVLKHLPMELSDDHQTLTMYPNSPQSLNFKLKN